METIGKYLKRVRETCGYSLEDVAGITRINLRYLEAIEEDDFAKIPGETFSHGFIRSFARCIGISDEEISSRIRETLKTEPQAANTQNQDDMAERSAVRKPGKARIILPAAAAVILAALLIVLFTSGRESGTIRNSKELKEVPAESIEVQPQVVAENNQVVQKKVEPVVLKVYARELTWISARIDDKETKEALLKPGDGVMWNGDEKVVITVGNAGGIDLDVNGKRLDPIGRRGEVIRDAVITSAGLNR